MTKAQILAACKLACRISSTSLDSEFSELIDAAYYDLEISGVADISDQPYTPSTSDQLVVTAVKTYVKLHMGDLLDSAEAERLETSYWNQKAQLKMRNYSSSVIPEEES
jgi:hypothetical protein